MFKMKYTYLIIAALISLQVSAQQEPQYTQYMYNMGGINPAYAGTNNNLSFGFLVRNQWTGLNGAPLTYNFFGHMPVGKKTGLGISIISDEIGPVVENSVTADFSYALQLNNNQKLSFTRD